MEMIISCMSWVPISLASIFKSLSTQTREIVVPVDIILDIFRRLPAELVFQCCHADDTLRTLTMSPAFEDTRINQGTSLIVYMKDDMYFQLLHLRGAVHEKEITLCFVDDEAKKTVLKTMRVFLDGYSPLLLHDSYYGLLLFQNFRVCIIWNPITQEQVVLKLPKSSRTIGFFFDPKTSDFKVIYLQNSGGRNFNFLIYNLTTQSYSCTSKFYRCPGFKAALIVNGALHWIVEKHPRYENCSEAILALDMESESVRTMAAPDPNVRWRMKEGYVHLLEIGGMLGFSDTSPYPCMCIWVLEDYAERVWIKKHTINLEFLGLPICCHYDRNYRIKSVKMDNGELVLVWRNILFRYNLKLHKLRKYILCYSNYLMFSLHRKSLVSLGN